MRTRLVLLPLLAGFASACVIYSGPDSSAAWADNARKDYALKNFEKVDAAAGVTVILSQGPYSVQASSQNGDLSRLRLHVDGDTLHIDRDQSWFDWGNRPHYTVTVSAPDYKAIEASSGSSIDANGLSLKSLRVDVSSGADISLSGSCLDLRVEVSSGANFDGGDLHCETASVDASSGADADAFASRSAHGEASSGADITFHGRPASVEKDTSSGGSIRAL